MLYRLKDAISFVGPYVNAGTCDRTRVVERINEVCRRLMVKADWAHSTQIVRIRTDRDCFPLPREVSAVRWVNVDNQSAFARNMAYEFLDVGPGEIKHRCNGSGLKDLVDSGMMPTMYDIPSIEDFPVDSSRLEGRVVGTGYNLIAVSTDTEPGLVTVYGYDEKLNDVSDSFPVIRWSGGVEGTLEGDFRTDGSMSTKTFRDIKHWTKPTTTGFVSLYAVSAATWHMYFLAKAHPNDTVPSWRRYRITNNHACAPNSNVLALCKLMAVPLVIDDDILPIQNLDAIKAMTIAIREENSGQLANAQAYEATAVRLLSEQLQDVETSSGTPVVLDMLSEVMYGPAGRPRVI